MAKIEPKEFRLKNGRTLAVRSAVPEDAEQLITYGNLIISGDAYNVTVPEEFNCTAEQEAEWVREHTEKGAWLVLTAWVDKSLIGMLGCENSARQRLAHNANVHLSVHPKFRRQGVGSALLGAAVEWAQNNPALDKISLAVFANNGGALALYRQMGFIEEGRRIGEVKLDEGEYVDDILMYKWVGP